MGVANKIPGVSGGIVALAAGFYEELIYSFSRFNKTALTLVFKREFRSFLQLCKRSFFKPSFHRSSDQFF